MRHRCAGIIIAKIHYQKAVIAQFDNTSSWLCSFQSGGAVWSALFVVVEWKLWDNGEFISSTHKQQSYKRVQGNYLHVTFSQIVSLQLRSVRKRNIKAGNHYRLTNISELKTSILTWWIDMLIHPRCYGDVRLSGMRMTSRSRKAKESTADDEWKWSLFAPAHTHVCNCVVKYIRVYYLWS